MKIEILMTKMLLYNDLPEIFLGKDLLETNYIFLLVDTDNEIPEYIAVGISEKKINLFLKKEVDLRNIFKYPELGIWFKTNNFDNEKIIIQNLEIDSINESYLPDEYFYINEFLEDKIIDFSIKKDAKLLKTDVEYLEKEEKLEVFYA